MTTELPAFFGVNEENLSPDMRPPKQSKYLCFVKLPVCQKITFLEGSQASPICPSGKSNMQMKMSVERWWNDTDRGEEKNGEKTLFQCHCVQHSRDRTPALAVKGRRLTAETKP
jgi:hypothetical protein